MIRQSRTLEPLRRWVIEAPYGTARYWISLTVLVSRWASNRRARLKMFAVVPFLPLRDRLHRDRSPHPVRFDITVHGRRLSWMVGPKSDLEIMIDLLFHGEYDDLPIESPEVILDLGSHIGASLLFFHLRFSDARIVGIEPNPATFRRLVANVGQLDRVSVHEVALAPTDGFVEFFPALQACMSSLADPGTGAKPVRVKGRTFDSLMAELELDHVDLMKVDIESDEFNLFKNSRKLQSSVKAMVGEIGDGGSATARAFFSLLEECFDVTFSRGGPGQATVYKAKRKTPDGAATL